MIFGRVIWKFELHPWEPVVQMPDGAELLSAGAQGDAVVVWALCDPYAQQVGRVVVAVPTGEVIPPGAFANGAWSQEPKFVATVQRPDGLVFHIFDGGPQR